MHRTAAHYDPLRPPPYFDYDTRIVRVYVEVVGKRLDLFAGVIAQYARVLRAVLRGQHMHFDLHVVFELRQSGKYTCRDCAHASVIEQECDHKQGFFSYRVVCEAFDRPSGAMVAEAMGACNSREQHLASDGDPFALHNVCLKMAEKRAFVNCALRLGMASDRFTQDMEDLAPTAQPSTILAIIDHIEHPAIAKQERPRIREFINREPEPDRAKEFLDRMKDRIEKYEAKRKAQAAPASSPKPATERPNGTSKNTIDSLSNGHNGYNDSNDAETAGSTTPPQVRNEPSTPSPTTPLHRGSPGRIQMAMAYLRAGLSINPLNGKVPAVPDWTKFAHQLPTTDHVSVWWHEHSTANLGIVCGPASGVFVLDQDGEQGPQSLLLRELPPTVKTGSGRHYYFALPSDTQFKNAVGFLPGLDLRTTGGQVVVPPSRHASGAKYVWDILPEQLARALADIDIPYEGEIQPFAEAPDWLLEEIANLAK